MQCIHKGQGGGQGCICRKGRLCVHMCPPRSAGQNSETRQSQSPGMHTGTPASEVGAERSSRSGHRTGQGPEGSEPDALCFQGQPSSKCFSRALLDLLSSRSAWYKATLNYTGSCCLSPPCTLFSFWAPGARTPLRFHTLTPALRWTLWGLPGAQQIWALLFGVHSGFSLFLEFQHCWQ